MTCRLLVRTCAALSLVTVPATMAAQVIRGTITAEGGVSPVRGAVVTLLDTRGATAGRRTLTDVRGAFALRAPSAGAWSLEVRAIGYSPLRTRARQIATGETVIEDVSLRRIVTRLAALRVEARSECRRAADLDPVASEVWDDVWAALASSEVARDLRLVRAEVFVYTREVDVPTNRVTWEERGLASVLDERPFRTAPAAELTSLGFWRRSALGNVEFYGIDAGTLISTEFLGTHCFSLVRRDSGGVPRIGLSFRPVNSRATADVQGTLWVDPDTRELRLLDFTYTGLRLRGPAAGGSMRFSRLDSGLLVDDLWTIQHPFEQARPPGAQRTGRGAAPAPEARREQAGTTVRLGGGFVLTDSARRRQFAMILGRAAHGGVAAEATTVEILGGGQRYTTDSSGAFLLRDVLPGTYEMRLLRQGSDEEGGFVQHGQLVLAGGDVARVDLNVPDAGQIAGELCPGRRLDGGLAPLFGVLRHLQTGHPAANYQVELQWTPPADSTGRPLGSSGAARVLSDWRGEFVACDVPSGGMVRFRTTVNEAPWSPAIPAGRQLRVIEIAIDTSTTSG
ncbi:MAG TPA: carboxypeptidase-like regulatory domain-containing protein [Gemmatimonadaceae bacterium]